MNLNDPSLQKMNGHLGQIPSSKPKFGVIVKEGMVTFYHGDAEISFTPDMAEWIGELLIDYGRAAAKGR